LEKKHRLVRCVERLGAKRIFLADTKVEPDFVFIQRKFLREAVATPHIVHLLGSRTRFFEFDLLDAAKEGDRFVTELWPKKRGLISFTYQGLVEAGLEGVEKVMKRMTEVRLSRV
jgi:hypothetical protein